MGLVGIVVRVLPENDHFDFAQFAHPREGEDVVRRWVDRHASLALVRDEIRQLREETIAVDSREQTNSRTLTK